MSAPRLTTILVSLLLSGSAWAHSPGAMIASVGLMGLLAVLAGMVAKRLVLKAAKWELRGAWALLAVGVAELIGLSAFYVSFFLTSESSRSTLWFGVAVYVGVSALFNSIVFRSPLGIGKRLVRGLALALVVPMLATPTWIGLLEPLYVLLGG